MKNHCWSCGVEEGTGHHVLCPAEGMTDPWRRVIEELTEELKEYAGFFPVTLTTKEEEGIRRVDDDDYPSEAIEGEEVLDEPRIDRNRAEVISFGEMALGARRRYWNSGRPTLHQPYEIQHRLEDERWQKAQRLDKVRDIYKEEGEE